MQELIKEFKRNVASLLESDQTKEIMRHNFRFFQKNPYRKMADDKDIFLWLKNIPLLRHNKILERLGRGVFGTAYKLDNGHVLKLYLDGGGDDEKRYESYLQRMFSGEGSKQDLAVFDKGSFSDPDLHGSMHNWVELPEIMPLFDWIRKTGREVKWVREDYFKIKVSVMGEDSPLMKKALAAGKPRPPLQKRMITLTEEEKFGIWNALRHYKTIVGPLRDHHTGNIAVYPHDPSVWVLFDN